MSELRKDYTTPEQSKRLLELGIPIESANIVYYHTPDSLHDPYLITEKRHIENLKSGKGLPCWSVGRLIEIYEICTQTKFKRVQQTDNLVYLTPLEDILMQIEHNTCGFFDNTKWDTNLLSELKIYWRS